MTAEMAAITRREMRELFRSFESPTGDSLGVADSGGSRFERQGRADGALPRPHAMRPQERTNDTATFDESIASQARIRLNRLQERLAALFDAKAKRLAKRMLMKQDRFSKSSLAESLKELSGGLSCKTDFYTGPLRETINASITANVKLITNLKDKYLFQIGEAVQRSIISGKGMGDLLPEMEKIAGMTKGRAKKIALDQTKKTYAAITRHRMAGAGITKFEWLHSGGGQRPRKFHMDRWPNGLNGGIFDMATPPVTDPRTNHRSFPGEDLGCNCKMIPVIKFEDGDA